MSLSAVPRLAGLALALAALHLPAAAESLASSASSAGSASSASISDSINRSSDSSSGRRDVADGDYRVMDVAERPDRPGVVRLTLAPADPVFDAEPFFLDVPQPALQARRVEAGDRIRARNRPYGLEFAHADTREPFFLALKDDWRRDLDPRPVAL